jgi:MoaA/NifB/PqqE/SkfB family radical SAM enzyme
MNETPAFFENKRRNEQELHEGRVVLSSMPRFLRVVLTSACNIDCIMCRVDRRKPSTLPLAAAEKLVALFPYLEQINWQGGEVFLVPYFKKLIDAAASYPRIHQTLQTNGLLFDRDWADRLTRMNMTILISVDSVRKETYEYIRKGACFEKLLENIALLNEYREKNHATAKIILCICIMRSNYREVWDFLAFAEQYGFGHLSLGFLHGPAVPDENIFSPEDDGALDYLRCEIPLVEAAAREKGISFDCAFTSRLATSHAPVPVSVPSAQEGPESSPRSPCRVPWTTITVDVIRGGNVYPECVCETAVGNIATDDIPSLWNAPLMQEYRRDLCRQRFSRLCTKDCFLCR